jgi:hypothetical protein
MAPRLRRFLHLERPRPARPDLPGGAAGVEDRFDAVLRGVEPGTGQADRSTDHPAGGPPILRWLRRRWW